MNSAPVSRVPCPDDNPEATRTTSGTLTPTAHVTHRPRLHPTEPHGVRCVRHQPCAPGYAASARLVSTSARSGSGYAACSAPAAHFKSAPQCASWH
eukprot:4120346-Prymnesium_polylepis.1